MPDFPRGPAGFVAALAGAALAGAAAFAAIQAWVPALSPERAGMRAAVREAVLADPAMVTDAMQLLRDRESARVLTPIRAQVFDPFPGAVAGNPDGDVTVAAYLDYACGYCRANLPALAELIAKDAKVRIAYREFPVLGEDSVTAARWALAAAEQGKFKPFHDTLYAAGRPDAAAVAAAAQAAGLDRVKAEAAVKSQRIENEIARNHRAASQLGVTGTPVWVIGDRVLFGLTSYDDLAAAVAAARKAK